MAAAIPVSDPTAGFPDAAGSGVSERDRWVFVLMAVWLIVVVLVGFIPDSVDKMGAVARGERPPLPPAMHVHAVLMGSWMLLLLTQTTLMATGRRAGHMQLGIAGMVLAPALVIAGIVLVPVNLRIWAAFGAAGSPAVQEMVDGFLHTMTNIALVQLRIAFCFLTLVYLGLRAQRTDPELHKRLMILATTVPLPAALDRMQFLPHSMPGSPLTVDLWPALCIAPFFAWDLWRHRTVHRAYLIWAALMVPTGIALNLLWDSPWWHAVAPPILYGGGQG